jgi:hypothetical protein
MDMLFRAHFAAGKISDFGLPQLSKETLVLARRLLAIDPTDRITAPTLMKKLTHAWLIASEENEAGEELLPGLALYPGARDQASVLADFLEGTVEATDARKQVEVAITLKEGVSEEMLSGVCGNYVAITLTDSYCALLDNFIIALVREARLKEYHILTANDGPRMLPRHCSGDETIALFLMKGAQREHIGDQDAGVDRKEFAWAMDQYLRAMFDDLMNDARSRFVRRQPGRWDMGHAHSGSTWQLGEEAAAMFAEQLSRFDYRNLSLPTLDEKLEELAQRSRELVAMYEKHGGHRWTDREAVSITAKLATLAQEAGLSWSELLEKPFEFDPKCVQNARIKFEFLKEMAPGSREFPEDVNITGSDLSVLVFDCGTGEDANITYLSALVFDCGTGETKVLELTYSVDAVTGEGSVSLKELAKAPGVINFIRGEDADKARFLLDLPEGTSPKLSADDFRRFVEQQLDLHPEISTRIIGLSAWARDPAYKEDIFQLTVVLRRLGIVPMCLSQEVEAVLESAAIAYAAEKLGVEGLTGNIGSGGGSVQFTMQFRYRVNMEIGHRKGMDRLAKAAAEGADPVAELAAWVADTVDPALDTQKKHAEEKLKGKVIATSACYYAASIAGVDLASENHEAKMHPASHVVKVMKAKLEELKLLAAADPTCLKDEGDKKSKTNRMNLCNLTLQTMLYETYFDLDDCEICFKRDWLLPSAEEPELDWKGKPKPNFRTTWSVCWGSDHMHKQGIKFADAQVPLPPPKEDPPAYTLVVECLHADGIKDVQWIGTQDPYVKVMLVAANGTDMCNACCAAHAGGGTSPRWAAEELHFGVDQLSAATTIRFDVMNDNVLDDDLIGSTECIPVDDILTASEEERTHELVVGGGRLHVKLTRRISPRRMSRFVSGVKDLIVGDRAKAAQGIWKAIGIEEGGRRCQAITRLDNGCAEIEREFRENGLDDPAWMVGAGKHDGLGSDWKRFEYVYRQGAEPFVQKNGAKRDMHNKGWTLERFCEQRQALTAGLTKAHVLALRLYTSNSYPRINNPLRDQEQPHPFPATTYYIASALQKLRVCNDDAADAGNPRTFWRGMAAVNMPEEVRAQGGAELACLSTSTSAAEARKWALSKDGLCPLLFKVTARDFMSWGIDIRWLSLYAEEGEALFPPMTYLKFGEQTVADDGVVEVNVEPSFPTL